MLKGKRILIGVTGSIAAIKTVDLVRRLIERGAEVKCVVTRAGEDLVPVSDLRSVCSEVVLTSAPQSVEVCMKHIDLGRWADLVLIMPATANFIAKLAHGIADDVLSSICLASTAQLVVVPAMNKFMWEKQVVQENVRKLKDHKVKVLGPSFGHQACGDVGYGRMIEPYEAVASLEQYFASRSSLSGKRILITSGRTEEDIDPVRFISNKSSGKMGCALAQAAQDCGADVLVVSGPGMRPSGCEVVDVRTAQEMYEAVMQRMPDFDVFISCAAIADYRVKQVSKSKIKKTGAPPKLELLENKDIISEVKRSFPDKFCVGFAAETQDVTRNALAKLERKGLDVIIANDVSASKVFGCDDTQVTIMTKNDRLELPSLTKADTAERIMQYLSKYASSSDAPSHI
jgi:phosphopantothenoylcysteine decarboxylase/phosphopantothenate--cysteine ligase